MSNELLPCPFCGGEAELLNDDTTTYGFPTPNYAVRCVMETCIGNDIEPRYTVAEKAIEDWNHRTPGWISVKERLPEPETEVLLVSDGNVVHGRHSEWLKTFAAHALEVPRVTHWMPLPEPPKEGKEQ